MLRPHLKRPVAKKDTKALSEELEGKILQMQMDIESFQLQLKNYANDNLALKHEVENKKKVIMDQKSAINALTKGSED